LALWQTRPQDAECQHQLDLHRATIDELRPRRRRREEGNMTPQTALVMAGLLQVLTVSPAAQERPDFSGRWTLMPERSVIQGKDGPITVVVFGTDFSVQREAKTLLVRVAPDLFATWRVNLDGSPTLQSNSGPDDRLVRTTVTATWEGETLIMHIAVELVRNGQSVHSQTRRRLTLGSDHTLTVEMPDGQDGPMIASVYRWLEPMP
jgi:hypothetical protein